MTRDDFAPFRTALERTGAAYGKPVPADLSGMYFDDLARFPLAAALAAIDKARQTSKFFPRVATLRELCATDSAVAVATDVPGWVNHDAGQFFCTSCDDTGFVRRLACAGDGKCRIAGCGREGHANAPHDYTRLCPCRGTNPILLRQRELIAQRTTRTEAA